MELEKTSANYTDSEEVFLSPSTVSTFNRTNEDSDEVSENAITKVGSENITKTPDILDVIEPDDAAYIIPIKIILPAPHIHAMPDNSTFEQFNYILLQTNDSSYHAHLANDKPDILFPQNGTRAETTTPTNHAELELVANGSGSGSDSEAGGEPDIANITANLVDSEGFQYQRTKKYQILNDDGGVVIEFEEVAALRPVETPIVTTAKSTARQQSDPASNSAEEQYDEHYSKILQWIPYKL